MSDRPFGRWPDGDRRTQLVFITQGLAPEPVEATFEHFLRA